MTLVKLKPTTPSQRHRTRIKHSNLWKGKPVKNLTFGLSKKSGRNNKGRITVRHKGGGHKKLYRIIDFKRSYLYVTGTVKRFEYDPNRSALLALISYRTGILSYIIAPEDLSVGDTIISGFNVKIKVGNALMLQEIPLGTKIHNIEMQPGKGGQLARSAGTFGTILKKFSNNYVLVQLSSGKKCFLPSTCFATIGSVSNAKHNFINYGKAGAKRHLGIRPTVRGVAMNPVDHPHGGGEGKSKGGRPSVTPWGFITKGRKTRSKKKKVIIT